MDVGDSARDASAGRNNEGRAEAGKFFSDHQQRKRLPAADFPALFAIAVSSLQPFSHEWEMDPTTEQI